MPPKQDLNLLAAVIATNGGKVDCNAIAAVLDTTYDTIENRMRKTKKEGQTLLDAACAAGRCDKTGKSLVSTRFAGNNNTKGSATPGSSKKRKGAAAANGDGDGDGEAEADVETPTKKQRVNKKKVKVEDDVDGADAVESKGTVQALGSSGFER